MKQEGQNKSLFEQICQMLTKITAASTTTATTKTNKNTMFHKAFEIPWETIKDFCE